MHVMYACGHTYDVMHTCVYICMNTMLSDLEIIRA